MSFGASIGVLANDYDIDQDSMTVSLVEDAKHGTLTFYDDRGFYYYVDELDPSQKIYSSHN